MERKITNKLTFWKEQNNRQPLILQGARQVGKTYILEEFGSKNYKNVVYVNFEQTPALRSIFDQDINPDRVIKMLAIYSKKPIYPGETLIFLDEIQMCDRALTALKYFAETANEYHVVSAGSLLGVALNRNQASFPVGKAQLHTLHPLDFEEFLWAIDQKALAEEIRDCFTSNRPIATLFHEQALELYRTYLCIGGMPAAVAEYVRSQSLLGVPDIQNNILTAYIADMAKYAGPFETVKVRGAFDSIPAQLAKENHKFQYKLIQ